MIRPPPTSPLTDTLFPSPPLFRPRPEWNPTDYNRADARGIGFDRTASGSDAVAQYAPPVARRFADLGTVGDDYLLWFHHLPWGYRMASGDSLWNTLVRRYGRGVDAVAAMQRIWAGLDRYLSSAARRVGEECVRQCRSRWA